jgi:hypothetical protein
MLESRAETAMFRVYLRMIVMSVEEFFAFKYFIPSLVSPSYGFGMTPGGMVACFGIGCYSDSMVEQARA